MIPTSLSKITRGHSCVICQQRKVKCDRQKPCSNCVKARVECVASAPPAPRRRRRKLSELDVSAKLRRYEQLLKSHGVKIEEEETNVRPESQANDRELVVHPPTHQLSTVNNSSLLFPDRESFPRPIENTLWETMRNEIEENPPDSVQESSDDSTETEIYPDLGKFLVGHSKTAKDLTPLHPQPVQIFRLWQTFLVNVNPIMKLIHAPTVQQTILDASEDLENMPRATEALMFSIYLGAITSLRNDECESMFGESRPTLLSRYSHGTQQALINAKFMKSLNIYCLQALVIYLIVARRSYDPHSLWILSGVAVRIAKRLGLDFDSEKQKVSRFDAEMRRRLWWQLVLLDGMSSKFVGAGFPSWLAAANTKIPLNINDANLSPTMTEEPYDHEGATEMLFCSLRFEVCQALRRAQAVPHAGVSDWHIATGADLIATKDEAINALELSFETKYLRYCDPSVPFHLLSICMAKSIICNMRVTAHHPRQYHKGSIVPQTEKDILFEQSLKMLEIDSLAHSNESLRGFLWHIHAHFQLDAFICVISELRHRTSGEMVERAWQQVQQAYEYRPEMLAETKNGLYVAVGNLALKAWQQREIAAGLVHDTYQLTPPRFISVLRSQRKTTEPARPMNEYRHESAYLGHHAVHVANTNFNSDLGSHTYSNSTDRPVNAGFGFETAMPDIGPEDWEYWQTLLDVDLPAYISAETQSW